MTVITNLEQLLKGTTGTWFSIETVDGALFVGNDESTVIRLAQSIIERWPEIRQWQDGKLLPNRRKCWPHTTAPVLAAVG